MRCAKLFLLPLLCLATPRVALAEGTAQLGATQNLRSGTRISVDILQAGEVINISAGNDADGALDAVEVVITDPDGVILNGGNPYVISPTNPGWLAAPGSPLPATLATPLQVVTTKVGVYALRFANTRKDSNGFVVDLVDPFDITVTPDTSTAVNPYSPPGGLSRVHSTQWAINAGTFAQSGATNAAFYVLTPTGPATDQTWKLQFGGLAGYIFEVQGNEIGMPSPNSSFSVEEFLPLRTPCPGGYVERVVGTAGEKSCVAVGPAPQFEIYLGVPAVAKGGGAAPVITNFAFAGPNQRCQCAVAGLNSSFTFESDSAASYHLTIDTNGDGKFDPASGDVLLAGKAVVGLNTIAWDGKDNSGVAVPAAAAYNAQLSVRLGEFHFVGRDIETAKPGLRIFSVDVSNKQNPVVASTKMYWNDTRIGTTSSRGVPIPSNELSLPVSTLPDGLASGDPNAAAICGNENVSIVPNAHCWGNFTSANEPPSPGNERYIDTWVFFRQTVVTTATCVHDGASDDDKDGITLADECRAPIPTDPFSADTDGDGLSDGIEKIGGTNPTLRDTDDDGLEDGVEDANKNGIVDADETDPNKSDTDDDGLPDGIEDANKNGKVDVGETDPRKADTDGDGIKDGVEDRNANGQVDPGEMNPLLADTDGDGLSDGIEDANKNGVYDSASETSALAKDTDGDGLDDGVEDVNKNGKIDGTETDPRKADSDGDGLSDGEEDASGDGIVDADETDPWNPDSDGDGLTDGMERGRSPDGKAIEGAFLSDPLKSDTDGDGLTDGVEDKNHNGVVDANETDPTKPDTDGDGLGDGIELGFDSQGDPIFGANRTDPTKADTDDDGLPDGVEDANHDGLYDAVKETDPTKLDTDGDGLPDGWIDGWDGSGVSVAKKDGKRDRSEGEDLDGDGIVGANETDPRKADTDEGGESDGSEVLITGHDPLKAGDDRPDTVALFGGRGCALGGSESGGGFFLFLLFAFVLRRRWLRRRSMAVALALVVGGGSLGLSGRALAQSPVQFPVRNFRPAASTMSYFVTEDGRTQPHLYPSVQLLFNYAHRPIQLRDLTKDSRVSDVVGYRMNLDLAAAIAVFDRIELGMVLPVALAQGSDSLAILSRPAGSSISAAVGDLRFIPKVRLHTGGPATLSIAAPFSVPTGAPSEFMGEDGLTFAPHFILSFDTEYFDMALNIGYRLRNKQTVEFTPRQRIVIDDEVFGSAAVRIALWKEHLDLIVDGWASVPIDEQDPEEILVEVMGGLRAYFPLGFFGQLAGGGGASRGVGAPAFRVLAGLGWQYRKPIDLDPDRDGILGEKDLCPNTPEDRDGFEDSDGCPDLDNDKDGIPDVKDKCPDEAEDKDGFQDDDGCPDLDNDGDGIADLVDKCPNQPEDKDGFEDSDGCPDPDNDGDGIPDVKDKCPNDPEDFDGFEDLDGCPDPDNDKDGIPDTSDKCPNVPEDKNGFQDDDGCPDGNSDRDGDGIPDSKDRCPLQPETVNGYQDDDGCPDVKPQAKVKIQHGKITVPPVFFATGKARILARSFPILRLVAQTLKDNKWVKKVRIEGHTDSRGSATYNERLSQGRVESVRRFLIDAGVDPLRLIARGMGESQPIASNRTREGRARNRRVEFVIIDPKGAQTHVAE